MISQLAPSDLTAVEQIGHFVCIFQVCPDGAANQAGFGRPATPARIVGKCPETICLAHRPGATRPCVDSCQASELDPSGDSLSPMIPFFSAAQCSPSWRRPAGAPTSARPPGFYSGKSPTHNAPHRPAHRRSRPHSPARSKVSSTDRGARPCGKVRLGARTTQPINLGGSFATSRPRPAVAR